MTPTLSQVKSWFNEYNALVFDGKLPIVPIKFNNTRRQLGQFYWGNGRGTGIKISTYYDRPEIEYKNTLVHEMCHLYCHNRGWIAEHHGPRWQEIARIASRKTGMNITRVHHGASEWKVANKNKAKAKSVQQKKNAPCLLVDFDYGLYHFIVKTTAKVLRSNDSTNWDCKLKTSAKSYKIYISTDDMFKRYQTSRSIHRGYKYYSYDYMSKIEPRLKKALEIKDLREVFQGKYHAKYGIAC